MNQITDAGVRLDRAYEALATTRDLDAMQGRAWRRSIAAFDDPAAGETSLVRVWQGRYVLTSVWRAATPQERTLMLAVAAADSAGRRPIISSSTAASAHGLPTIGAEWRRPHLTVEASRPARSSARLHIHRRRDTGFVESPRYRLRYTPLDRVLVELLACVDPVIGISATDHALRMGATTQDRLTAEAERMLAEPDQRESAMRTRRHRLACRIAFASPLAESPGESLSRVRAAQYGFTAPELQREFRLEDGSTYRVDMFWAEVGAASSRSKRAERDERPHRLDSEGGAPAPAPLAHPPGIIGEFDGEVKYTDPSMLQGRTGLSVVRRERARDRALVTEIGPVVHWDWRCALEGSPLRRLLMGAGVPVRHRPIDLG